MRRVVKVGGSLLTRSDLDVALPRWLERQPPAETIIIAGGGTLLDAIRELDRVRPGDPVAVHWQCVSLLDVTFEWMATWFEWHCVRKSSEFESLCQSGFESDRPTLVAVTSFYQPETELQGNLPKTWETTTDSIAAFLAHRTRASELVILKSCEVDSKHSPKQLADAGIVDEAFPRITSGLPSIRVEKLS